MPITWDFKNKVGEAFYEYENGEQMQVNLYQGNALLIFVQEFTEDGVDKYRLDMFFNDLDHAKRTLGLLKGSDGKKTNLFTAYEPRLVKIRFDKSKCREWKKLVDVFSKASFENFTIELYTSSSDKEETT
jgi:hypothetical protein